MIDISFDYPKRIEELCKEREITKYRLCMNAKIPTSTFYNLVGGKTTTPNMQVIISICEALDIDLPTFFNNSVDFCIPPSRKDFIIEICKADDRTYNRLVGYYDSVK